MGNFSELKVWQRSKDLAVNVYKLTLTGKMAREFALSDQMRRAAISIPSNIAEGDELNTDKQSIRHFYIAKGSAAELLTQLIIAKEIDYLSEEIFISMKKELEDISSMLNGLIKHRAK